MYAKNILTIVFLVLIIPIAFALGNTAASDPVVALIFCISAVILMVSFYYGRKIWLLIFLAYPFVGGVNA